MHAALYICDLLAPLGCRNAIQVQNMHRAQVGHIPKRAAGQLAPLMDARMISLEGVIVVSLFNYSK